MAVAVLQDLNLERLSFSVPKAQSLEINPFFTIKTLKPNLPFRTIITERDSWWKLDPRFLKGHLKQLRIQDPFKVENVGAVVQFLQEGETDFCKGFSIDVEDMFFFYPNPWAARMR
ncbi:hypothetical protein HPB48_017562 [Haemaphysalis longicornis]|uniref:Uncharacterized protein n=1 Tax=Haemaphysalis longicornis TaxID=44386 RepID=A0A9J6FP32_HAELO|nr:hypothetical protein HPB48_017562 [Haemaphysalis longicornis]